MLAQVLPHGDGCRNADVQALDLPELGNGQGLNVGVGADIRTDAEFFMTKDEGTAAGKGRPGEGRAFDRIHREDRVTVSDEIAVAGFKVVVETCRDPFKGSHGRGRVKKVDAHQVDFTGAERVRTSEYLANVKGGFQPVQNNNKIVGARAGQEVGVFLSPKALLGRDPFFFEAAPDLSESHGCFDALCLRRR